MAENNTRNKILEKSTEVLCSMGIAQTTMNILADEIGLSRRTLYRYFDSKEDIAHGVMLFLMEQWNEAQTHTYEMLEGNGLMKLEQHFFKLMGYMEEHISIMRFMADYDNYFKDTVDVNVDENVDAALHHSYHFSDVLIVELIHEGVQDGSIVLKEDTEKIVATLTNVLWIFAEAISVREKKISKNAGVDSRELIRCLIHIYIEALRKS